MTDSSADRWIQRAAFAAMIALAAALLTVGITLYGTPRPSAGITRAQ